MPVPLVGRPKAQSRHHLEVHSPARPPSIESQIEAAVERTMLRVLGPYLHKLTRPEPAVYTVAQAAVVLQVSQDTVARLVKRGILARVPHVDGKMLIPRRAIDSLVESTAGDRTSDHAAFSEVALEAR